MINIKCQYPTEPLDLSAAGNIEDRKPSLKRPKIESTLVEPESLESRTELVTIHKVSHTSASLTGTNRRRNPLVGLSHGIRRKSDGGSFIKQPFFRSSRDQGGLNTRPVAHPRDDDDD